MLAGPCVSDCCVTIILMKGRIIMREQIFEEINKEREYQDQKWGSEFDDRNTVNDWATYISIYAGHAADMGNIHDIEQQRLHMLKVASLAVAALETFDRNNGFAPRHYEPVDSVV